MSTQCCKEHIWTEFVEHLPPVKRHRVQCAPHCSAHVVMSQRAMWIGCVKRLVSKLSGRQMDWSARGPLSSQISAMAFAQACEIRSRGSFLLASEWMASASSCCVTGPNSTPCRGALTPRSLCVVLARRSPYVTVCERFVASASACFVWLVELPFYGDGAGQSV